MEKIRIIMKRYLTIIMFFSCIISCTQNSHNNKGKSEIDPKPKVIAESLINTKWECKIAEGCVSSYSFFDSGKSIFYSCESEDKYYGNYYVENDTIYIHNYVTDRDSLLTDMESSHRSQEAKYKLSIQNGMLRHLERWFYSEASKQWKKDNFVFDDSFVFSKVQ